MANLTRRSLLRGSLGVAAVGALARPHIANAAATTAEVWWNQGFVPEEDVAFRAMVADYEKASGNKIDHSLVPNAPLRQKEVSAITSGVVPGKDTAFDQVYSKVQNERHSLASLAGRGSGEERLGDRAASKGGQHSCPSPGIRAPRGFRHLPQVRRGDWLVAPLLPVVRHSRGSDGEGSATGRAIDALVTAVTLRRGGSD